MMSNPLAWKHAIMEAVCRKIWLYAGITKNAACFESAFNNTDASGSFAGDYAAGGV